MKVVTYRKTDQGREVVGVREVDTGSREGLTPLERVQGLFTDVPLLGGKEWETFSIDELVQLFREAGKEAVEIQQQLRDEAVREHRQRSGLVRWWREVFGWKEPFVPTIKQVLNSMAKRCQSLSSWTRTIQARPFYADSDMEYLAIKPSAVAAQLIAEE